MTADQPGVLDRDAALALWREHAATLPRLRWRSWPDGHERHLRRTQAAPGAGGPTTRLVSERFRVVWPPAVAG